MFTTFQTQMTQEEELGVLLLLLQTIKLHHPLPIIETQVHALLVISLMLMATSVLRHNLALLMNFRITMDNAEEVVILSISPWALAASNVLLHQEVL
jgi:hypothetical protein